MRMGLIASSGTYRCTELFGTGQKARGSAVRALKTLVVAAMLATGSYESALGSVYDGNWVALIPPQENCNWTSIMTLTMSGNTFQGETRNSGNTEAFTGRIDADGNGSLLVYRRSVGTITFTGDHFDANWNERTCRRHAIGDRALTRTEAATAYAQRKQFQSKYSELKKRATAADDQPVDFTALRSLYPYTDQWDPYGNKTAALLNQAAAASAGKDCATALEKLDEVLKIDFTIDAAHALRSDCLAVTGQQSAAKIESNVADGLIHSLMNSGDGNTEGSAYVVMTQREELDVLANRHLVLKGRETQMRGSNGHLYDVIRAVSDRDAESIENVYFDANSFVNGRESRMAAIETLESSMP